MEKKLLNAEELIPHLAGISRSTFYRMKRRGKVPFVQLSDRKVGYDLDVVIDYFRKRHKFNPPEKKTENKG